MGIDVTRIIQTEIKSMVDSWLIMKNESADIYKVYWSTDANTKISGLTLGTDAATLATKLTKTEYLAGITMVEDIDDFFVNSPVSTTDYLATCELLKYGSAATPAKLSEATEALGDRMYQVALDCVELFKKCKNVLEAYSGNEVGDMIANLDIQRHIPGSEMTKDELSSGIVIVEQFKKMINA